MRIQCHNCRAEAEIDKESMKSHLNKGWRNKSKNMYCPKCAKGGNIYATEVFLRNLLADYEEALCES